MKALTALPTQAYVQAGEEANVPLQDLLQLVQELETNVSPAYIARYRPDVAAGLNAARIQEIQNRLRSFLDLADRRVTILTAINQQGRLTPELREQIEGSMDRRELEDLYLPFKPKRRTAADDAVEKGLEGLALYLWKQEGEIEAEAAKSVKAEGDTPEAVLAGACDIIARWLGENSEIRRDIRKIAHSDAEIAVQAIEPKRRLSGRDENHRKRFAVMDGYRAPAAKAPWRQVLSLRRGAREGWLQFRIEIPETRALQYLEGRLVRNADSPFAPHLESAARKAFEDYLAPAIEKELRQELDERCDAQAVELYKKNLRKLLLAPPAGPRPMVGLETNRPGGWRAAVIGADGALLETAIVREDPDAKPEHKPAKAEAAKPKEEPKAAAAEEAAPAVDAVSAPAAEAQADTASSSPSEAASEPAQAPAASEEAGPEPAAEEAQAESAATSPSEAASEPEPATAASAEAAPEPAPEEAPGETAATSPSEAASEPELAKAAPAEAGPEGEAGQTAAAEDRPEAEAEVRATPETSAMTAPAPDAEDEAKPEEPVESQGTLQFESPAPAPESSDAEIAAAASESAPAPETAPADEAAEVNETAPTAETAPAEAEAPAATEPPAPAQATGGEAGELNETMPAAGAPSGEAEAPAATEPPAAAPVEEPKKPAAEPKPKAQKAQPSRKETLHGDLAELIARHQAELVVFGNGPGLRQVERVVRLAVKKSGRDCAWLAANEAGSWIYATSKAARKAFPDHEPAVRSAACLARRVQDPIGELIKLDPRVLGIGQGHHEVDQKNLRTALREAQESAVHEVGVDVNAASAEMLSLVPGMTERVARRIVEHRRQHGPFPSRAALSEMAGLNARVYEQAAGFLRVYGGENPLDGTGVHPRDYAKLGKILEAAGVDAQQALEDPAALAGVDLAELTDKDYTERALKAILRELDPRVRNPRGAFEMPAPTTAVEPIDEPKIGMKVEGVITNVADFGLFVDIGAEQDGLVHVSQLAAGVTREGEGAVKTGDRLTVYVVNVANEGKRISLSMREPRESSRQRRVSPEGRRAAESHRRGRDDRRGRSDRERTPMRRTFGPDDRKDDEKLKNMSLDQKLDALQDKFRTKV